MASSRTYFVSKPEFVGRFPVRTEIEVIPADKAVWCPLCDVDVHEHAFRSHCREKGDPDHLALEVLSA